MPSRQLDHQEVMSKRPRIKLEVEIILVLDQLIFQENIAGICRVANSMGVKEVWLVAEQKLIQSKNFRSISRLNPKSIALRTFESVHKIHEEINHVKKDTYKVVALEFTDKSDSIVKWNPSGKIILLAGSERHGISQELLDISDQAVHIPMLGDVSSLNVNQAVSIALYEMRRNQLIS